MKFLASLAVIAALAGAVSAQYPNGTADTPILLFGGGLGPYAGFLTTYTDKQGRVFAAVSENYALASNNYIDEESRINVQPAPDVTSTDSETYLPIQLLNSGGPMKGIHPVKLGKGCGTTGFYISPDNLDVFSTNPKFGYFYTCTNETVEDGVAKLFWGESSVDDDDGDCGEIQFTNGVR